MTHVSTHPDRLWIRQRTVYVDEHQRVWRANLIPVRNNIQVHLRYRGELPTGEALSPREIGSNPLPSMWQLYSSKRYRGSNSNHWHIAYHIRFGDSEDMLLVRMVEEEG